MLRGWRGGYRGGNGNWHIDDGEWENDSNYTYNEDWTYGECFDRSIWATKAGLITLFVLTVLGVIWTNVMYMWYYDLKREQSQGGATNVEL